MQMYKPALARHGLARILSKRGVCSRTEAARWITAGRVTVDARVVTDPEYPVIAGQSLIAIDGVSLEEAKRIYLALNKPRGLVTSTSDERERDTVYSCFDAVDLPWVAPVGRLDKASEGLLLFSNDAAWAAAVTAPESALHKTYHVQIDCIPEAQVLAAIAQGAVDKGERLSAISVAMLRSGGRNAWLEVVLDEGRNRHIRRLLEVHGIGVLRLIRVAIGPLALGDLKKGEWRMLTAAEAESIAGRALRR